MAAAEKVMTGVTTIEEVFRVHWCQLNVKPIARLGMNSQSNSGSCLLMTKEPENCLVNFSLLWLLACEIHFWAGVEAKQISHL
ncbi:MAG: hypothetical protein HEQ24_09390 [Dolichospermum sp. BR01]|nr:hypothetical protein [Dolichospermum sp. BR01]